MNAQLAPRVWETSTTTGTGTLSLAGAVSAFQTFVSGFGTGNKCYYTIVHGTAWEVGEGTVTDATPDTLSRDTVLASSAGGAKLNLGVGTKQVFCDVTRESVGIHGGYLFGLGASPNATDLVNDIDFNTGQCCSDDATEAGRVLISPAAMTKRLDATWVAGTNQGGRLASDSLADGTWHCFAFKPGASPDDFFFSTSLSPTPPSGGTKKRRISSVIREGSANVLFVQDGDFFQRRGASMTVDVNNPGAVAVLRTMAVPNGLSLRAVLNVYMETGSAVRTCYLSDPAVTDEAASQTVAPLGSVVESGAGNTAAGQHVVRTNTARQIRTRFNASEAGTILRIATLGWFDRRGKDA